MLDVELGKQLTKLGIIKLLAIISNYGVWDTKLTYDVLSEERGVVLLSYCS